ncbi:MAG: alpha/beta fold hydrolase [Acidimicrobiales bacterium]
MPTAGLNGIDIYYERSGSGPELLFLNGSGATLATAAPLTSIFAKHFDVVAHDQRGLGQTSIPPGPYTMADYAADAAALASHVGWERYRVVGISFGGMVAQELALTVPERIVRLALLCTSPGGAGGSSFPLHTLAGLEPEEQAEKRLRIMDTRFDDEWLATHEGDRALVSMMGARLRSEKDAEVERGEALQLEARIGHDVYERLGQITCPTLVASGRYDGIASPANGEAIAAQIKEAELRLYEGGHMFVAQDRTALPEIVEFLLA